MLKRKVLFAVLSGACLAGVVSGALTSQSYVTRGLVASYDAIDNAGVGVHNNAATGWKDLTDADIKKSLDIDFEPGNCCIKALFAK